MLPPLHTFDWKAKLGALIYLPVISKVIDSRGAALAFDLLCDWLSEITGKRHREYMRTEVFKAALQTAFTTTNSKLHWNEGVSPQLKLVGVSHGFFPF